MLSITDFSAFERMLNNALDGNTNVFDLGPEFMHAAGRPTHAQPVELNFTEQTL